MITIDEGLQIISPRIIRNTRHEHYARTVDRRKLYHAMLTGDDIEEYLMRFDQREDLAQFKARKKITQQCVSPACNEAVAHFDKLARYPNIKKELRYDTGAERIERLHEALRLFCNEGDVQEYLAGEFDRRSLIDPNAFLVLDFGDFDAAAGEVPRVYGVYVDCDNVIDFDYLPNGELDYLFIEQYFDVFDKEGNSTQVRDYVGYLGDDMLLCEQIHENRVPTKRGAIIGTLEAGHTSYSIRALNPQAGQVQAFRLGYIKDPITNYKTCVSPLDKAETVVMDLNNDKSEYDTTKRFHVFPQKFQFAAPCPGESDMVSCRGGRTPDHQVCSVCKGSGVKIHMSSSDVITLPLPKDKDDYFIKLADMTHYAKPDIEIIKHLREDVESSKLAIKRAIFTAESAVKTDGALKIEDTATKEVIKQDDMSNILLPYGLQRSRAFKFIVYQIAAFNDIRDGLTVLYEYPQSLRLETIEELQEKYAVLVASKASLTLLDDIDAEIGAKRFMDDPDGLKRYNTWRLHRPFRNMASEEIEFIIGAGLVPKWLQVLWGAYDHVMTELENTEKTFYDMQYSKQRELIKAATQLLVTDLEPEEPEPFLGKPKPAEV